MHKLIQQAAGRRALPENDAFALLDAYGIRVPKRAFARDAEEAIEAAERVGYPVALKIVSPDILHKSDVGGVRVGIGTRAQLVSACGEMLRSVAEKAQDAAIEGFLLMESLPPGLECVAGMLRDEQLGTALMFGLGGVLVEVMEDVAFDLLPITREDARAMIGSVRGSRLLGAYRGAPPKDIGAAADLLVRLGRLAAENPEIAEIDINPFLVYERGAVAVDARMLLR